MKFYLISDNIDSSVGMRLAGIEGSVVHTKQDVEEALDSCVVSPDIGIILITEKLAQLVPARMNELRQSDGLPLVVEIPDRHGTGRTKDSITHFINESIGIKF